MYALVNPENAVSVLRSAIGGAPRPVWLWLVIAGGLVGFAMACLARRGADAGVIKGALLPVAAALPFAALPNIWGYSAFHTIADLLLVAFIFLQLLVFGTAVLFIYAASVVRSKKPLAQIKDGWAALNVS